MKYEVINNHLLSYQPDVTTINHLTCAANKRQSSWLPSTKYEHALFPSQLHILLSAI